MKRRILVLGGGCGALSAAFYLSHTPALRERFDVTVLAMGWRLGGKGASGRREDGRIEEHGLHVWGGFYHNAFRLVRDAYAAADRASGPFRTWTDAFVAAPRIVWLEPEGDAWVPWVLDPATTPRLPGDAARPFSVRTASRVLAGWARQLARDVRREPAGRGLRRATSLLDLVGTLARGLVVDRVAVRGFYALDDEDLAGWLARHGARPETLTSAPVRAFYDYFFAYEGADPRRPRLSAGAGLYHLLRLMFTYEGALFWKMRAGMGDAVFAPLYEACRRQGVRFRFFHRVDRLVPRGTSIARVDVARQLDADDYEPLVDVDGVPSWPREPRWERLRAPEDVRRSFRGLEDPRVPLPVEPISLEKGRDYDALVLGVPVGALADVARPIADVRPEWRAMLDHLPTVATGALQLWHREEGAGLAGRLGNVTGSAFADPLQSWSDMSQALPFERRRGTVTYHCGAVPDGTTEADLVAWERHLPWLFPDGAEIVDRYVHVNDAPSDRYVLDLPGTNRYRLEADTSGFEDLALAGDWLFTGLGGSVESAVMAGMQAAKALGGGPDRIVGALTSPWRRPVSVRPL